MRADDLRRGTHRSRVLRDLVRHRPAQPDVPRLGRHPCPQHHRRRGQDHQRRQRHRRGSARARVAVRRCLQPRHGAVQRAAADDRTAGVDAPPADHRADPGADRRRQGVRRRWRRLLRGLEVPVVRQALAHEGRRARGRRAGRRRRAQARPRRLRAVEERQAGRAVVGGAVGQGTPGVAHRVLRDVGDHARHHLRSARWRQGF